LSNTSINPRAVMIELINTAITNMAMVRAWSLNYFAKWTQAR